MPDSIADAVRGIRDQYGPEVAHDAADTLAHDLDECATNLDSVKPIETGSTLRVPVHALRARAELARALASLLRAGGAAG